MQGGGDKRWAGERLAVSPTNSQVLLFGSRQHGLWRTEDGGANWQQSTLGAPTDDLGVTALSFDPGSAGRVFASVWGDGVYTSSDDGKTWARLADSPAKVMRFSVASNGALWAAHGAGVAVFDAKGAYGQAGRWLDRTPAALTTVWGGIGVNPQDASEVIATTGETPSAALFHSRDGGATWQQRSWVFDSGGVPWYRQLTDEQAWYRAWVSAITFEPHVAGRVWYSNWFLVGRSDDVRSSAVTWKPLVRNLEVLVNLDVIEIDGKLLSGHADAATFRHGNGTTEYPTEKLPALGSQAQPWNYTAAFARSNQSVSRVFQVGFGLYGDDASINGLARSDDGGRSWSLVKQWPTQGIVGRPTRLAVSAADDRNTVVLLEGRRAQFTEDGVQWGEVSGLPDGPSIYQWGRQLAADGAAARTFYSYDVASATVYRSIDGGRSFAAAATGLQNSDVDNIRGNLKAAPDVSGEVWLSLSNNGLHRSTDSGSSFTKIAGVDRARVFGFGKAAPGATAPTVFVYGQVGGQDGVWMSTDSGASWTNVKGAIAMGSDPMVLEGSPDRHGVVYVGTAGRGVFALD
jgi:xyloglucan-specific exo-beta-1,4-glucanase